MQISDTFRGLVNAMSGLGGERDKAVAGTWAFQPLERQQLESAYRSNWMARKAVDIPAFDMMREGWAWQADEAVVGQIENEEKRLGVRRHVLRAIKLARLYGGAAIIVSDGSHNHSLPLNVERIGQRGVSFIKVLDRYHLLSGDLNTDPLSPNYLEPNYYDVASTAGGSTRVHPSRVIRFIGVDLPTELETLTDRWGDSILDAVETAIRDATSGQQGIAALIQEAKVDVFRIDGFMQRIQDARYKQAVQDRFGLVSRMKSLVNAVVLDKNDEYEQKTVNFSALPDVQRLQLQIVSGAVDIPATRFLSQAPQGMNATGEGDERNYYQRIGADQELTLRDPLERLFGFTVRSALGTYPDDLWFRFRPLWQMSDKERAEIFKTKADAARTLAGTGGMSPEILPIEALSDAMVNTLEEDGTLIGLADAIDEYGKLSEQEDDPAEIQAAMTPQLPPAAGEGDDDEAVADAAPRALYVSRKVLNGDAIVSWAKSQGLGSVLPAADLHVTIAFSRAALDWMKVGESWNGELKIAAGGPRMMERFGDAVVLLFASSELSWRHEAIRAAGASWDHPEYQPHITISYAADGVDLSNVEPYRGEIVLGPEIFAEVEDDW
ncbi:DUF1073 domain-containing protein [Acuticoccus sp. M5D2P5]|uniref:phage portal protein n=1 Tax=Acuticoccus kalidii TaxID=2910977 RepID=UPI001F36A892|nr:anti-CBASS Acb1 family protein [Acuticoccus kalidii]MCF3934336.1 DUF1073 domain-containing protein [Acuticoccus kalidii]